MAKKTTKKQAHAPVVLGEYPSYIQQYAPDLLPVYLTLLPFSYLFGSTMAGPQKGDGGEQFIELHIDDPRYPGGDTDGVSLHCRITATKIVMHWYCMNGANGKNYHDEDEITMSGLWDYLRQIPRPYHSFLKGSHVDRC